MAALAATKIADRFRFGNFNAEVWRATLVNTSAADEWIATDLQDIEGAFAQILGVNTTVAPTVELNARGTGVAEDVNPGDLGFEGVTAGEYIVLVFGR